MLRTVSRLTIMALAIGLGGHALAADKSVPAPLPEEEMTVEKLAPADGNRLYVTDPTFGHMVDGRMYALDGASGRFLGMIGTGFGALTMLAPDGKSVYVVTTYYPRLSRGKRDDVVEIHDAQTLELKGEIDIPAKRAEAISYRSLLATSADGRFLYVQNATPATSVTVVDLAAKKAVSEIATPGCWSIHPWTVGKRFSTICGDGTLQTITLDESGQLQGRDHSAKFFDPDKDPIYIHPEVQGDHRYFVSYQGDIYGIRLAGDAPSFDPVWSLLDSRDKKAGWRPGGLQVMAMHQASNTLFVNMHDHGYEGSHKNPGKEVWAVNLTNHQRVARIKADMPISIVASQGAQPKLYMLNIEKATIDVRKIAPGYPHEREIKGVGETSMFMEVN